MKEFEEFVKYIGYTYGPLIGQEEPTASRYVKRFARPTKKEKPLVGRNDPCPCGSGKKYKKCCLI